MKRFAVFAVMLVTALQAAGQNTEEYMFENGWPHFMEELQEELTYPLAWGNSDITDFSKWREAARAKLEEEMLLPPRKAQSYDMKIVAVEQREGYTARKLEFNLTAYSRVSAYLLVPDTEGPHPAVLLLHDHGAHFVIGKEKMVRPFGTSTEIMEDAQEWADKFYDGQFVGDYLAQNGYVVLCTDAPLWGERGVRGGTRREDYRYIAGHFMLLGRNISAWMNFEDAYAADFLAQLPEVDSRRVGCMGFSMGAYRAWMLSALSDTVKCGAAVCWMHTTEYQMNREYGLKNHEEWANMIPGIRRYLDYPHIASIACPKPMLFINGTKDHLFPEISVSEAFGTMHQVWDSQYAGDKLQTELWDMGHHCGIPVQQRIITFFQNSL